MSTWTTPITWTVGQTVTKAQMDAEIRDHLNHLYNGVLNKLTGGTFTDTGVTIKVHVDRAATTDNALDAAVSGDAVNRIAILAGGKIEWRNGTDSSGLVNLYKNGADILTTDDSFTANDITTTQGVKINGTSGAALLLDGGGGIEFVERTDPAAPGANRATLFVRDNGAGKTQLCVRFNTGAVQAMFTQV